MNGRYIKLFSRWQNLAAFLFFALCLNVPSGYSWGAALAALLALVSVWQWAKQKQSRRAAYLAWLFVFLGLVAQHDFDGWWAFSSDDVAIKYTLAALCMLCVHHYSVRLSSIQIGLVLGLFTTLGIAIYQFIFLKRAMGFTNAIQFGDIAAGLALVAACVGAVERGVWRWLLAAAALAGAAASLLSLSRGGWVLLLLIVPLWVGLSWTFDAQSSQFRTRWLRWILFVVASVLATTVLWQVPVVHERMAVVKVEMTAWAQDSSGEPAKSSIGQRLEQWRLHGALIAQNPWTGYGKQGLQQAKREMVERGQAHESVLLYGHAHNELLQAWAQRGLLGVLALVAMYGVPLALLWPTSARRMRVAAQHRPQWLALCVAAMSVPVVCFVAGLTQMFFAHNSGDFFYAFTLVFLVGAMRGLESGDFCEIGGKTRV